MKKTSYKITKMDCPSEENLIRTKLGGFDSVKNLDFDLEARMLSIYHTGEIDDIDQSIRALKLGEQKISTEETDRISFTEAKDQRKLLWVVLVINFAFFLIEMTTGLISRSMGLVADSLDMLADAFVYGISLYAVGGTIARKKNIATVAGYFQLTLALIGFAEVLRRFLGAVQNPDFTMMIYISILALIANGVCLYLLQKSKSDEAHMKASMIFTSNDVIINLGVIVAGILVSVTNSNLPDLLVGTIVFVLVVQGALRILKLGR